MNEIIMITITIDDFQVHTIRPLTTRDDGVAAFRMKDDDDDEGDDDCDDGGDEDS